jgi:phosphoribosylglycinamide formyltransferase-1
MTKKPRICLLTYDTPHLKTAQVLMGLHNRGFRGIDLLLMPFTKRPERPVQFQHRPSQFNGPTPSSLTKFNGGKIIQYTDWRNILENYDWFIVCGSNLIEAEFANSGRILNAHSGLIPSVRGLDSFKWAILNHRPLGNTLHKIDERADVGEVMFHLPTPVFVEDDLHTLARRHYENEIWMLTNFHTLIERREILDYPEYEATMRMPMAVEAEMMYAFESYKATHAQNK